MNEKIQNEVLGMNPLNFSVEQWAEKFINHVLQDIPNTEQIVKDSIKDTFFAGAQISLFAVYKAWGDTFGAHKALTILKKLIAECQIYNETRTIKYAKKDSLKYNE